LRLEWYGYRGSREAPKLFASHHQVLMHKAFMLVFERPHFIYTIVPCSVAKGPQIQNLHFSINKVMCSALSNNSRAHRIIHVKDLG